jgi:pimeloyl-ACP methyl ester carboxylesterase
MSIARHGDVGLPIYASGDGERRLVFAHGLQGLGERALAANRPLVDAGWSVACFDQRGHGDATPVYDSSGYDADAMGADLWAVADAMGWDRCWIGGGSMGAATSFRAAKLHPERVEGLVQVCPALWTAEHRAVWLFDQIANQLRDEGVDGLIRLWTTFMTQVGATPEQLAFLDDLRLHDPESLECALRNVPRWIFEDAEAEFASLDLPVIVVCWDGDYIHPIETGRSTARAAGVDPIEVEYAKVQADPLLVATLLADELRSR